MLNQLTDAHAGARTRIHAPAHTHIRMHRRARTGAHAQICARAHNVSTRAQICRQTRTRTRTGTNEPAHMRARAQTCTQTCTWTRTHKYRHAHRNTRTDACTNTLKNRLFKNYKKRGDQFDDENRVDNFR